MSSCSVEYGLPACVLELLNSTDDVCHAGGGCQAVCAEDNQLGHLGVPAVCYPDQR